MYAKKKIGLLLAIIMALQFILPVAALAAGEKNHLFPNANIEVTITQDGNPNPIGTGNPADSAIPIKVNLAFPVPVKAESADDSDPTTYIAAGDVVTMNLGTYFKLATSPSSPIDLYAGSKQIGRVVLTNTSEGVIATITFSDPADEPGFFDDNSLTNVRAGFEAELVYDESKDPETGGEQTVSILGKTFNITLPAAAAELTLDKTGTIDWSADPAVITWQVDVEARGATPTNLSGYTFSDTLTGDTGTYVPSSFTVNGAGPGAGNELEGFSQSGQTISYLFPAGVDTPQTITFKTALPNKYFTNTTQQTIENTAEIEKPGTTPVTDKGSVLIPGWGSKAGKEVLSTDDEDVEQGSPYSPAGRYVRWNIIANRPEGGNEVTITDVIDDPADNIARVAWFLPDGEGWGTGADITPVGGPYTYTFLAGNLSDKVMLSIWQKVPDDLVTTTQRPYSNTAHIVWTGITPDGSKTTVSDDVTVGYNAATKSGAINLLSRMVAWTVNVDTRGQNADDMVIYDLFVYGTSISDTGTVTGFPTLDNSVKAKLWEKAQYGQSLVDSSLSGSMTKHTLYQGGAAVADLLEITNLSADSANTFTFTTNVLDLNKFISTPGTETQVVEGEEKNVYNTALLYKGAELIAEIPATVTYKSRLLDKEVLHRAETVKDAAAILPNNVGDDSTGFNHKDRTVIFRFSVNAQGVDWNAAYGGTQAFTLTDTLPTGWAFERFSDGSDFLIYHAAAESATSTARLQAGARLTDTDSLLDSTSSVSGSTATLKFKSLTAPYVILLKAKVSEEAYRGYLQANNLTQTTTITNTVALKPDGTNLTFTSKQDIKIRDDILTKEFNENTQRGYVTWMVEYKPYDVAMSGNKLVDRLPVGLDVRIGPDGKLLIEGDNFKAYKLESLQPNGTYAQVTPITLTEGSNISYNNADRDLTFTFPTSGEDGPGYRFVYITDITGETGDVQNSVKLFGGSQEETATGKIYSISRSQGWAQYQRAGWVKIHKTDGTNNNAHLANAWFTVYTVDGATVIRTGKTDGNGNLTLRGLPAGGSYILKETEAPAGGYVLNGTIYMIVVGADGATTINGVSNATTLEVINYKDPTTGGLEISKMVTGAGDKQKVFEFTITFTQGMPAAPVAGQFHYRKTDGTYGFLVLDADGKAEFTLTHNRKITIMGLPKDAAYTITEKNYSDEGYYTSSTGDTISTIVAGTTKSATFTNHIPTSPGPGGALVRIYKVDSESGTPLAGAEFTLYDSSGKAIRWVTTDGNGYAWFANLPNGNYTIKETQAPYGYAVSPSSISLQATGGYTEYTVTNVLKGLPLPTTGDAEGVLGIALIGCALLLGAVALRKRRTDA